MEFWQGEVKSGKVKHKSRGRKPTYLGATASATGAFDKRSAMGQGTRKNTYEKSWDTNIRTGPKAAGKGSGKGKKSPKETKRSKGAGKGSGSKKERSEVLGHFGCMPGPVKSMPSMQWQCRRQLPRNEKQSLL